MIEPEGSPIPGSQCVRAYCRGCGEPMRVYPETLESPGGPNCEVCSGVKRRLMPSGYSGPLDEDSGGYGSIARRCLEDG